MPTPKKSLTKRRQGNRRSQKHGKLQLKTFTSCSNCNAIVLPGRVCLVCGFYKGKNVLGKVV